MEWVDHTKAGQIKISTFTAVQTAMPHKEAVLDNAQLPTSAMQGSGLTKRLKAIRLLLLLLTKLLTPMEGNKARPTLAEVANSYAASIVQVVVSLLASNSGAEHEQVKSAFGLDRTLDCDGSG